MKYTDFNFSENTKVNDEIKDSFQENGYIILRGVFDREEISKLKSALELKEGVTQNAYGINDGKGRQSKMCLWNQPGDDITGMVARVEKVAGIMEKLLDGEIYHYHSKLIMKEARTGGRFAWHQDYGYWYNNGCIYPQMGSVMIAIDKSCKENGCLRVLQGSQKVGRIEHTRVGEQAGADLERVEFVKKFCELKYVELEPGDALFFHCNVLHTSDQNNSDMRRWCFICSYNRADNDPVYVHHHPNYTKLEKVPNSAIKTCNNFTDLNGKDFHQHKDDKHSVPWGEKANKS